MKKNKLKISKIIFVFALFAFFFSCEKTSTEPFFDVKPRIELVEVSQDTLIEFTDQLILTIKYEDGDGDLGSDDSDVNSLFIKDARLAGTDEYYVGPLAPIGSSISITGTLNVELSPTFLLGNGTEETTVYTIYMVDRKGNQSNIIETEPILITN